MKTFIKWSGNKGKHLRHILPHIPEFTGRYIEPFLGSGALFLKLAPEKWIINDLNKDLVNVWKLVRDDISNKRIQKVWKEIQRNDK